MITQAVEHPHDQLTGSGDDVDGDAASSLSDPIVCLPELGAAGHALHRSTAAHPTSVEPCVVTRPRCTLVSGLVMVGVSPAYEASCPARAKQVMSPISATNTAPSSGPTRESVGS